MDTNFCIFSAFLKNGLSGSLSRAELNNADVAESAIALQNTKEHAMNKSDHSTHTATIAAKTCYEGSVISRAMERAGHNPHLKGHIHEVLVQDLRNISPDKLFAGRVTEMTRSTTAKTVDLVTCKAGKVVERLQLKDTPASIGKVIERVKNGQYRTAQLVGTTETTEAFNSAAPHAPRA